MLNITHYKVTAAENLFNTGGKYENRYIIEYKSLEELLEVFDVNIDVPREESESLVSIIQRMFEYLSVNEILIWDSELADAWDSGLADASKDPQLDVETVSCVCGCEKGLWIYLQR